MAEQFIESSNSGSLNGTTPVTLVPAPTDPQRHVVRTMTICNLDDAIVELTITLEDAAATDAPIVSVLALDPGDTLVWSEDILCLDTDDKSITAVLEDAPNSTNPTFTANYSIVEN